MKITLYKPELFASAARFVSTDPHKTFVLQGVNIEPHPQHGVIVVGLDGHRMFVGYDENATFEGDRRPVAIQPVKSKLPAAWFNAKCLELDGESSRLYGPRGPVINSAPILDGTFPEWRRVIPEPPKALNHSRIGMNYRYVFDFGDIGDAIGSRAQVHPNSTDPALVTFGNRDDCLGILMPERLKEDWQRPKLPGWLT